MLTSTSRRPSSATVRSTSTALASRSADPRGTARARRLVVSVISPRAPRGDRAARRDDHVRPVPGESSRARRTTGSRPPRPTRATFPASVRSIFPASPSSCGSASLAQGGDARPLQALDSDGPPPPIGIRLSFLRLDPRSGAPGPPKPTWPRPRPRRPRIRRLRRTTRPSAVRRAGPNRCGDWCPSWRGTGGR